MGLGVAPTRQQLRSWRGHPAAAAAVRVIAFTTPIATALASSVLLADVVPRPAALAWRIVWCAAIAAASTVVLVVTDRVAKRVLPLAALLKLSLVFPDHVPSRFSVALRSGTTKQLVHRLQTETIDPGTRAGATELLALVAALNHHDPLTRGHSERVRALSDLLAEQLQLDADDREKVRWAALLHDIGKLRVPTEILRKPGKPTASEWEVLKTHPAEGVELVRGPIADWLGEWARAIGEHHEQFDGSGYPAGLAGSDISLAGRLVAVADVFDVITASRSYKKAMTIQEGLVELTRCAGTQFDPDIVRAFLQISIGDLRRAMGTLSWLAQLSLFGRLATAPTAATVASGVAAITGLGIAPVMVASTVAQSPPGIERSDVSHMTTPVGAPVTPRDAAASIDPMDTTDRTRPAIVVTDAPSSSATVTPPVTVTTTTEAPAASGGLSTTIPPFGPVVVTPTPTGLASTLAPTVTVVTTSVPTTSVPAITVPPITVPPITVPLVTIAPVTLPPVTLPPVTVPVPTTPVGTLPVSTTPPLAPLVTVPQLKL